MRGRIEACSSSRSDKVKMPNVPDACVRLNDSETRYGTQKVIIWRSWRLLWTLLTYTILRFAFSVRSGAMIGQSLESPH